MRIVQGDQVAAVHAVRHRGGGVQARIILEGTPGTPGNFALILGVTGEEFVSPRHRHNFEQYRIVLDGKFDFGRDGLMVPGVVGYFPEGLHYGPQTSANDTLGVVLQFGGVSGNGYLSNDEVNSGMEALQQSGEFKDGVFRRRDGVPGRKNQDAFEAIWEHMNGREVVYPVSSHPSPVMMNPTDVAWSQLEGCSGVAEKRLGKFETTRTGARMLQLDEGARWEAPGRAVYLTLSGSGAVDAAPLRRLTAFEVEAGEIARIEAQEPVLVLQFELPAF